MDSFPIERISQGRDLIDNREGANGGHMHHLVGGPSLGTKKGI